MRIVAIAGICAVALAGGASARDKTRLDPDQEIARVTKGGVAGKPVSCINQTFARQSQRIEGVGMVYRIGRTYYVNRFDYGCPLGQTDILITSTPSTQLCRGDSGRIIESTSRIPKGSCIFSDFIPYTRPK